MIALPDTETSTEARVATTNEGPARNGDREVSVYRAHVGVAERSRHAKGDSARAQAVEDAEQREFSTDGLPVPYTYPYSSARSSRTAMTLLRSSAKNSGVLK